MNIILFICSSFSNIFFIKVLCNLNLADVGLFLTATTFGKNINCHPLFKDSLEQDHVFGIYPLPYLSEELHLILPGHLAFYFQPN